MEIIINDKSYEVDESSRKNLLEVLREDLGLTGSKYGCGEGQCGACTVMAGDEAIRSCITPVANMKGKKITTIEGIGQNGDLHPVQKAFLEEDALQCGYCTPGMIMASIALLEQNPTPGEEEIKAFMDGNICRCGVYPNIMNAIKLAAK